MSSVLEIMTELFSFPLVGEIAAAPVFEHPGGLHSRSQVETSRKRITAREQPWTTAFEALLEQAKNGLDRSPEAVSDFNVPGYYSDAEGHRRAMERLSQDAWAAYSCAVAYQLPSGKEKTEYADKAIQILAAWATTNQMTSNFDGDLAMADAGVGLVLAAELMTDYDGWEKGQRAQFTEWLRNVYLKSCERIVGKSNNWGDWGVLGCIASHYFLDDALGLDADIERMRKTINHAIEADGHMPAETRRDKNGIWYTYFAIAPLTAACQIAYNARAVDLFHYKGKEGAGIEQALDYLLQYSREPQKWPHYRGEDLYLPKPGRWPGNLFEAMSGIYGKLEYEAWVEDARPIMVHGHHYAWAIPTLLRTVPPHKGLVVGLSGGR